jgi:hypothetical protein
VRRARNTSKLFPRPSNKRPAGRCAKILLPSATPFFCRLRLRCLLFKNEGLDEILGRRQIAFCGRKVKARRFHSVARGYGFYDLFVFFWF